MHFLFALPGLHRFNRGAEVVFQSVAQEIARNGEHRVTLVGSGPSLPGQPYEYIHLPAVSRERFERWPKAPFLRTEFMYEELTFAARLASLDAVGTADVTMTCSYPYVNWALRRPRANRPRPPHVFVTQNGDWPSHGIGAETRFFGCEGMICTNPIYFERNRGAWPATLIPNGVDPLRFNVGASAKARFGLPADRPVILMVSALEPAKRVIEAMRAVADVPEAFLLVAGDGPLRDEVDQLAARILPGRFRRATFSQGEMPDLYRSANLFLHTKILESFGNVYVEALSCGSRILVHDDAVARWILGEHACFVDSTSQAALAAEISQALAKPHDGRSASKWAHDHYSWQVIGQAYAAFLAGIAESRSCRRASQ